MRSSPEQREDSAANGLAKGNSVAKEEVEPNLLRFGLRRWFAFISAAVIFLGLMARLEVVWGLLLASIVALIVAHVFGTFLGTRLRDTSADVVRWKSRASSIDADRPVVTRQPVALESVQLPEATTLAGQNARSSRSQWALAGGGLLGAMMGGAALSRFGGPEISWPGIVLGAVSCGVIGAWIALLGSNFYAIAREAWRHASQHD